MACRWIPSWFLQEKITSGLSPSVSGLFVNTKIGNWHVFNDVIKILERLNMGRLLGDWDWFGGFLLLLWFDFHLHWGSCEVVATFLDGFLWWFGLGFKNCYPCELLGGFLSGLGGFKVDFFKVNYLELLGQFLILLLVFSYWFRGWQMFGLRMNFSSFGREKTLNKSSGYLGTSSKCEHDRDKPTKILVLMRIIWA